MANEAMGAEAEATAWDAAWSGMSLDSKFDRLFKGEPGDVLPEDLDEAVKSVGSDVQLLADASKSQGGQEPLDARANTLKSAADHGFDCRCSLGQLFAATAGGDPAYRSLKGVPGSRKAQAEFRQRWAQEQFQEYVRSKDTRRFARVNGSVQ
eukprot:3516212-Alexandrium_andersonii.AAC.1